jgi:hypothetical protein
MSANEFISINFIQTYKSRKNCPCKIWITDTRVGFVLRRAERKIGGKSMNKAEKLLEQFKPELLASLSTLPPFGILTIALHVMDNKIKRVVVNREESILTEAKNEG